MLDKADNIHHAGNPDTINNINQATPTYIPLCPNCGDEVDERRFDLGYKLCLWCGEEAAKQARKTWCVAPMHKSNYLLITDKKDLTGLNNKGGLVK